MQFKYPEILWGLFLLLIPIIIHLFQLRRFKKTPFTNVKFLKQVVSESRKSSSLKKWLLLATRLGLLGALVIAFAQPFIANEQALQLQENVYYLDNSFSMGGQEENSTLLKNRIQEFLKFVPVAQQFTLFTNTRTFKNVDAKGIQNELLNLPTTSEQLGINEILLKAATHFTRRSGVRKNLVLVSDFQQRMGSLPTDTISDIKIHYVKPKNFEIANTSIDSVYIGESNNETVEVLARLTTNTAQETIPVSLYNETTLIAKTAAKFNKNKTAEVRFTINAQQAVLGRVAITDTGLEYDNQFYFNIDEKSKIKVLAIGTSSDDFLSRIFLNEEFDFQSTALDQLNYSSIENQNLVVLNELTKIPASLITSLNSFVNNGGSFVMIPAMDADLSSYNQLANGYGATNYENTFVQRMAISSVKIAHPLFANVFEKEVSNFQFPYAEERYKLITNTPIAIEFQNQEPFLGGNAQAYFFSAALNNENSNFKSSPLIVPTFYNMGMNSLKLPPLYANLGRQIDIELPITLQQDDIIKISNGQNEFIPQQRILPKKVTLTFLENPKEAGIYQIKYNDTLLRNISFNESREESELLYLDMTSLETSSSFSDLFQEIQKSNAINEFWKWFAILAMVFVLMETLLQRFFK